MTFRCPTSLVEAIERRSQEANKSKDAILIEALAQAFEVPLATFTSEMEESWLLPDDQEPASAAGHSQPIETLDQILSAFPDLVFVQDRMGRFVYVNAIGSRILGWERKFFLGKTFQEIGLPPETSRLLSSQRTAVFVSGRAVSGEISLLTVYQNTRDYEYIFSPIQSSDGNLNAVVFTARDITERKQTALTLQESEEKYRSLFEAASDSIFIVDASTHRILNANWNAARLLGYSRRELLSLSIHEIQKRGEDSRCVAIQQKLQTDGSVVFEHVYRRKDGAEVPVEINAQIIEYENSLAIQSFVRDISDRKRTETEIRQQKELLQAIINNIPVMITSGDETGKIELVNKEFERVLGWSLEELQEIELFSECYPHPEDKQAALNNLMAATGKWHDFRLRISNGQILETSWANVRLSDGTIIGIGQDITERKQAEEVLRRSEARYRAIVEDQTELITRYLPNGIRTFVNSAYCRYYGQLPEGLIGKPLFHAIHEQDREQVYRRIASISIDNPVVTGENRVISPTGEIRWQQWSDRGIFDAQGNLVEIQAVGQDITDRKLAEAEIRTLNAELEQRVLERTAELQRINDELASEISERQQIEAELRQAQEKYRSIFDNAIIGIFQTTLEGAYISANPTMANILGYGSPADLMKGVTDIERQLYVVPGRRTEFIQLTQHQDYVQDFESQIYRKDGSIIWISENVRVVRQGNGTALYYEGTALDITQRKQAETLEQAYLAEVAEWRNRYEAAGQASGQILFEYALTTGEHTWGPNIEQILGYSSTEIPKRVEDFVTLIHPEDRDRLHNQLKQSIATQSPFRAEYRIRHKNGIYLWIEDRSQFFPDATGALNRVVGFLSDISDRKQADQAVRDSEERYRTVVEDQSELVCRFLPDGTLTFVNSAYCRHFKASFQTLIGRNFVDLIPEPFQDPVKQQLQALTSLTPDESLLVYEHPIDADENQIYWQQWTNRAIFDAEGHLIEVQAVGRDISDRKQVEAALQKSEERFRSLIETTSDLVWEEDENAVTTYMSPNVRDILGYEPEEVLGKSPLDLMTPEMAAVFKDFIEDTNTNPRPFVLKELMHVHKAGHQVVIETSAVPIFDAQGKFRGYRGIDRDITERKRVENDLREREEKLRTVFDHTAVGIIQVDAAGRYLQVNQRFCEMVGYSKQELLEKTAQEITHPEDVGLAQLWNSQGLSEQKPFLCHHQRLICKNGQVTLTQQLTSWILDREGQLQSAISVVKEEGDRSSHPSDCCPH